MKAIVYRNTVTGSWGNVYIPRAKLLLGIREAEVYCEKVKAYPANDCSQLKQTGTIEFSDSKVQEFRTLLKKQRESDRKQDQLIRLKSELYPTLHEILR